MAKIKVQDATKELSSGASKLLERVSRARRQTQDALKALTRREEEMLKVEREAAERVALEEEARRREAEEAAMSAYSSEQSSEAPAPATPEPEIVKMPEPEIKAEEKRESKPAAEEKAAEKQSAAEARPEAEAQPRQTTEAAAPEKKAEASEAPKEAPEAPKYAQEARPAQQPVRPQAPQGARPAQPGQGGPYGRPVQPGQGGPYGRPVQPGQGGPYGRPVQPGQGGPYGRPVQPGQGGQGQFGRPPQGGQGGQFGRPPQGGQGGQFGRPPQGGQGQFGRPPQGGQGGQFGRPPQGGQGGQFGRPPQGGFGGPRPGMGGQRPAGGFGGAGARARGPELTPTVEKERVSNYDPNKKNYVRQNDPERTVKKQAKPQTRGAMVFDEDDGRGKRRPKKGLQQQFRPEPIKIDKAFMTAERITVKDLSERIGKPSGEIIKKLLLIGIMATINEELDFDTAQLVCTEFGVELELKLDKTAEDALIDENFEDAEDDLELRDPIVTIMGHVDHGKTSLLDYIRKAHVTAGEAGGITQHIGAYTAEINGRAITFLDTPGHEAFTAMRARGAQVTDIAVLVVAADDGVMPQTIEAINHAKAAKVPTIVAINKCDKPTADPDRIKQQLTEYGLVSEEWGGETIMVPVSAVTGENVDTLMEMILLVADVQDLRANPNRKARGTIIEAKLDKGRGPVATVLVINGTLRIGDTVVAGTAYGRVRAMVNDKGERVSEAGPSQPVEVIGFNDVPSAGDSISAVDDDRLSRQVAEERKDKLRAALIKTQSKTTLDDLYSQISAGQVKDLNIIIKADVQGSVEAVKQSLEKLSNEEVRVRAIHGGVGAVTETDVMLAAASDAIVIGFNVRYDNTVRDLAEREKIDIRLYRVIYDAIEDVQNAMKGMLAPKFKETSLGKAQVRQVFKVTGVGMVAGCMVTEGKMLRNARVRLMRDGVVITETKIDSLRRFKDDAREVASGFECGIGLENYSDVKEGDVMECFQMDEIAQ